MTDEELLKLAATAFGKMGQKARQKKLGEKGLSDWGTKAVNARWEKWRKLHPEKAKKSKGNK